MNQPFDSDAIAELGWRQGAILDAKLAESARRHAPTTVTMVDGDWLIVTSHDCDVVNFSLAKEPVVEVMRASVLAAKKVDKQQSSGRNPRTMQLAVEDGDDPVVLSLSVHDRWFIPRDVLLQEPPARNLPDKERRLIAEWLAKRYIRAAFPTAFDLRWRAKLKDWQKLLKAHSEWIQGIYLRLSTLDELPDDKPYKCHLLVAVPHAKRTGTAWPLVDAVRVRPDAEIADVQHPLEAHAERLLEGEDVLEEPVEGSVDIAGGADDHGSSTMPAVGGQSKLGATDQVTKFAAGPPSLISDQVPENRLTGVEPFHGPGIVGRDGRPRSPVCPRHPGAGALLPRPANPATTGRTAPTVARQPGARAPVRASGR